MLESGLLDVRVLNVILTHNALLIHSTVELDGSFSILDSDDSYEEVELPRVPIQVHNDVKPTPRASNDSVDFPNSCDISEFLSNLSLRTPTPHAAGRSFRNPPLPALTQMTVMQPSSRRMKQAYVVSEGRERGIFTDW